MAYQGSKNPTALTDTELEVLRSGVGPSAIGLDYEECIQILVRMYDEADKELDDLYAENEGA